MDEPIIKTEKAWNVVWKKVEEQASFRTYTVDSSNVAMIGYDDVHKTLRVHFNNGGIYDYLNVTPEAFKALHEAESIGKHLNANIKPNYEFKKVS